MNGDGSADGQDGTTIADESKPLRKRRQLGNNMAHMQYAVTADPVFKQPSTAVDDPSKEADVDDYGVPRAFSPPRRPYDAEAAANLQKRTDPFSFGSRYLAEGDDIFRFNAWDHVETDDAYRDFAEAQYAEQRAAPVSDFDRARFNRQPERFWNTFYTNNTANFFKDRKWLAQEFPVLSQVTHQDAGPVTLLEVGAGAGNTAFPVLARNRNPQLKIHACDFSKKAIELIRKNDAYDERFIRADVWDAAAVRPGPEEADVEDRSLPPGLDESSVDVVIMIFIFSALSPSQWADAVRNVSRVLRPGGLVLFRDYGRGDLAQVRFKRGRWMEDNFYVRGDGTRVYFFEQDQLRDIWTGGIAAANADRTRTPLEAGAGETKQHYGLSAPFELLDIGTDRRLLVNRQRKLKMYRCWIQARFRKAGPDIFSNLPAAQAASALSQATEPLALEDGRSDQKSDV